MQKYIKVWTLSSILGASAFFGGKLPVNAGDVCGGGSLGGWVETFCDDFNGDRLDSGKWRTYSNFPMSSGRAQFMADDVWVNGGALTLRIQKRQAGGRDITSGGIDTLGRFAQS